MQKVNLVLIISSIEPMIMPDRFGGENLLSQWKKFVKMIKVYMELNLFIFVDR